ncbi:MAG: DegV family protein [Clostridia bacterium]|nr:DegV family protein [Clostridia bacterium]
MIKIMVDSGSDCRDREVCDYFVPLTVNAEGREYRDGIDLDCDMFYYLLTTAEEIPHTSQPSPDAFLQYFKEVKANGDELIYFTLSSALSGTYQSACIAREMAEYDGIYIVDSRNFSHMIVVLAKYAKKLISRGMSAKYIVEKCEELKKRIKVCGCAGTLEYLRRGGRIGKAAAFAGTMANIKPIMSVSPEGTVEAVGKAIGVQRAVQTIADKLKKTRLDEEFPVFSLYSYGEEYTIKLEKKLRSEGYHISERLQIGPTIGTHLGPGVFGISFVEKKQ